MKKGIIVLVALLVLGSFTMANAFDLKGIMGIGAFVDYGFGFGDNFEDEVFGDITWETSLGFSFGAQFMYGFTDAMAVMVFFDYMQIKYDVTGEGSDAYEVDNENFMVFAADFMYFFNTEATLCPFVMVGPGFYVPSHEEADSKLGFNGGIGALYFFQENMALEFGGRFHYILDSEDADEALDIEETSNTTYAEIFVGFKYFFGGME